VLPAAKVTTLEPPFVPEIVVGANVAVTPAGNPLADRTIDALKPFWGAAETVTGAFDPAATVTEADVGETVNVGVGTTTETVSVVDWLPLTAFTVSGYVPAATVAAAEKFSTSLPDPGEAIEEEANVAVKPVGIPVTDMATAAFTATALEVTVV
jgi:hypothetical protein